MNEYPQSQSKHLGIVSNLRRYAVPVGMPFKISRQFSIILLIAFLAVGGGCLVMGHETTPMALASVLTIACMGFWATGVVPHYWTALLFFLIANLAHLAPMQTVLSGFASSTFWLFLSGLILSAAIRYTKLDQKVALLFSRMAGYRYSTLVFGCVFLGLGVAFVIPSAMGRVALLVPIVSALSKQLGYRVGENGHTGMVAATAFGTHIPAFTILSANAPNMLLAGMAESTFEHRLSYWNYLSLHFPVLGFFKAICIALVIVWLFPAPNPKFTSQETPLRESMSKQQMQLLLVLGGCLGLWLSDDIHHISSGWIGLAAAVYCLYPGAGLTSKKCLREDVDLGGLFFIAGVIGLGAVLSSVGLGKALVHGLSQYADFSPGHPLSNVVQLIGLSTLVGIATNLPGIPAVMTPMAGELANLTGLSLTAVLMAQVMAFSNLFLPYQAPPLITAMQLGKLPFLPIAKLCLVLFIITIAVVIPLDLLWWQCLGML